ncbi:unnamed protein product, partial [Mesorhabditis spiculigera]
MGANDGGLSIELDDETKFRILRIIAECHPLLNGRAAPACFDAYPAWFYVSLSSLFYRIRRSDGRVLIAQFRSGSLNMFHLVDAEMLRRTWDDERVLQFALRDSEK